MGTLLVVELDEIPDSLAQPAGRHLGVTVHVPLLYRAPEPLNPDVVLAASAPVHADGYAEQFESAAPRRRGVLAALTTYAIFQQSQKCEPCR